MKMSRLCACGCGERARSGKHFRPGHGSRVRDFNGEKNPFFGKKHGEGTKIVMRSLKIGKKHSSEHNAKIKASMNRPEVIAKTNHPWTSESRVIMSNSVKRYYRDNPWKRDGGLVHHCLHRVFPEYEDSAFKLRFLQPNAWKNHQMLHAWFGNRFWNDGLQPIKLVGGAEMFMDMQIDWLEENEIMYELVNP